MIVSQLIGNNNLLWFSPVIIIISLIYLAKKLKKKKIIFFAKNVDVLIDLDELLKPLKKKKKNFLSLSLDSIDSLEFIPEKFVPNLIVLPNLFRKKEINRLSKKVESLGLDFIEIVHLDVTPDSFNDFLQLIKSRS